MTILLQCLVVQSMYILPHFYLQWTCSIIDLILCLIVWLLLLSSPFVSQVFTAFLGITHFCAVGIMWPCTLTQKMANGFLEVFQYSLSGHSSSTLFDCSSFGHYRNNTMQFLTICCSWNSRNGCLYVQWGQCTCASQYLWYWKLGVVVHVWIRCRLQSAWYEFFSAYNTQKIILNPVVFDPCWRCCSNSKDQSHRLVYQVDLASS